MLHCIILIELAKLVISHNYLRVDASSDEEAVLFLCTATEEKEQRACLLAQARQAQGAGNKAAGMRRGRDQQRLAVATELQNGEAATGSYES